LPADGNRSLIDHEDEGRPHVLAHKYEVFRVLSEIADNPGRW
jgi:hypothetical protein